MPSGRSSSNANLWRCSTHTERVAASLDSLTAVIVNHETADYTIRAARALVADGVPPERIVVVDNGSEDDSFARFNRELPGLAMHRLERNVGFARGSNAGARALPGDAYLMVNSDAFVHSPGTIARMLAQLAKPGVGVVAPRLLNVDLSLQPNVVPVSSPQVAIVRASGLSRFVPNRWQPRWSTHWDHSHSREVDAANGAVLLVRAEALDELGGFEEAELMYAEDLDLCWRARRAGWKVWFAHDAEFVHVGAGATARKWSGAERARRVGAAETAMIRRNLGPVSALLTLALTVAGVAARWVFFKLVRNTAASETMRGSLEGYLRLRRPG